MFQIETEKKTSWKLFKIFLKDFTSRCFQPGSSLWGTPTAWSEISFCFRGKFFMPFAFMCVFFHGNLRGRKFLYFYSLPAPTKIWYHFSRYCFLCLFACSRVGKKKVLFHFLMHGKSNGSRHPTRTINPTSNQHEIYVDKRERDGEMGERNLHPLKWYSVCLFHLKENF